MFDQFELMRMSKDLALHAAARQSVVAANLANADTPGYKAADLQDFAETYRSAEGVADLRRTRPDHLPGFAGEGAARRITDNTVEPSPNGNTVALETELVRSSSAKRQHDVALAVYKSSLDLLRSALGRGR